MRNACSTGFVSRCCLMERSPERDPPAYFGSVICSTLGTDGNTSSWKKNIPPCGSGLTPQVFFSLLVSNPMPPSGHHIPQFLPHSPVRNTVPVSVFARHDISTPAPPTSCLDRSGNAYPTNRCRHRHTPLRYSLIQLMVPPFPSVLICDSRVYGPLV